MCSLVLNYEYLLNLVKIFNMSFTTTMSNWGLKTTEEAGHGGTPAIQHLGGGGRSDVLEGASATQ
jgi:hypothetical protein